MAQETKDGATMYKNENGDLHNTKGPAFTKRGNYIWAINGSLLSIQEEDIAKSILADPTLAPLYINHHVLRYFSMEVLGTL